MHLKPTALLCAIFLTASISAASAATSNRIPPETFHAPGNAGAAFAATRFPGRPGAGVLYASNFYPSYVEVFGAGQPGTPLIGTIANGVSSSYNLTVDKAGTLYVQNNNGTIAEYAPGAQTPSKVLYETVNRGAAVGVAIGPDGTVYSSDPLDGEIFIFANGSTSPTSTLLISSPLGLAVSAKNVLYVDYTSSGGRIEAYPDGKAPGKDLGISLSSIGGLAIDPSGNLLAGDQNAQKIDVFTIGSSKPLRTISTAPAYPYQFTIDRKSNDLYVASGQPAGVFVFDYTTGKPLGTVTEGFSSQDYTTGVAFGPP